MKIKPLPLKHEGHEFDVTDWGPAHPAHDCELRFESSVNLYGQPHTPRGQAWQFEDHVWTCYMWRRKNGEMVHRHSHFVDWKALRQMVEDGKADNPFILEKYVGQAVSDEAAIANRDNNL
jgi:hypothetical protein